MAATFTVHLANPGGQVEIKIQILIPSNELFVPTFFFALHFLFVFCFCSFSFHCLFIFSFLFPFTFNGEDQVRSKKGGGEWPDFRKKGDGRLEFFFVFLFSLSVLSIFQMRLIFTILSLFFVCFSSFRLFLNQTGSSEFEIQLQL